MVYCGLPSKGCLKCRKRKIRCDQRPEGCLKCEKMGQQCPGYRDQLDLMFRNENRKVETKSKEKSTAIKSLATASFSMSQPTPESTMSTLNVVNMYPSNDEKALGFFFTHHVIRWGRYRGEYDLSGSLLHTMRAVGLAGLMASFNAPSLKVNMVKEHIEAIRLTNKALRSPVDAKKDSTLLGIVILGMFEVFSGQDVNFISDWEKHLKGATAVLELRGVEQVHTPTGRRLFMHVANEVFSICLLHQLTLPKIIWRLKAEAEQYADQTSRAWQFIGARMAFVDFYAKVHASPLPAPFEIIEEASRQDQNLISIFSDLPLDWRYSVVETDADPDIVFRGRYRIYPSYIIAQAWNMMNSIRILLHSVMYQALARGLKENPSTFSQAYYDDMSQAWVQTSLELQADILSSVPQHLGYVSKRGVDHRLHNLWPYFEATNHDPFEASYSESKMSMPDIRLGGQGGITRNLWFIGRFQFTPPDVRRWVLNVLYRIGSTTRMQHATLLADHLEGNPDPRSTE